MPGEKSALLSILVVRALLTQSHTRRFRHDLHQDLACIRHNLRLRPDRSGIERSGYATNEEASHVEELC